MYDGVHLLAHLAFFVKDLQDAISSKGKSKIFTEADAQGNINTSIKHAREFLNKLRKTTFQITFENCTLSRFLILRKNHAVILQGLNYIRRACENTHDQETKNQLIAIHEEIVSQANLIIESFNNFVEVNRAGIHSTIKELPLFSQEIKD